MKHRVLVTGATGFMGKRLVKALIDNGCSVRVLVRNTELAHQEFQDSCEIVAGDTTRPETLVGCCDGVDIVYHLAALMGHDLPSEEAFKRFRAINVQGTVNIVRECQKAGVKRFIHVSSTAAMGLLKVPVVDETTECAAYTPYQVSKYESECFVMEEYRKSGFPAVVLRPSMIYGPGFKGDFLTIAKVCKKGIFPTIGRGDNLSPALYITDLIHALILFAEKGEVGQIYLLSSEQSYTLRETAMIISESLNKKLTFIYVPVWAAEFGAWLLEKTYGISKKHPPVTKRNIQSMVTDRLFDINKAKEVGFVQQVSFREGLSKTINYFKEQGYV
ncbi:MAG: SDR family NAD(P)-dependent oxidoreductase [Clostridia bacterium]|nr:SDR family NAD(P)-dependent oxidoreductase [Clostridia bacterium]